MPGSVGEMLDLTSSILRMEQGRALVASTVFWAVYCDMLIKELRHLGVGAYIAALESS